jgi:tetrahydromethanopterin S-methyltransferase subunit C
MNLGFGQRGTVIFIFFLSLSMGISAVVLARTNPRDVALLLIQAVIILLIISILMLVGRKRTGS